MIKRILAFVGRWTLILRLLEWHERWLKDFTESGRVHKPSWLCWYLFRAFAIIWQIIQVGRVRVVGKKNLHRPGRVIYCPNHTSMLDAIVVQPIFPEPIRGIGAFEQFRKIGGLEGIVLAKLGCIPVDRSQGKTVLGPATNVVAEGSSMIIFPEGKISPSAELLQFKFGPAYIANAVYERLGEQEEVSIVPIHICYHSRETASALNYWKMGFKWRGNCTITVLDPIRISELKDRSPEHIMLLVRNAITSVSCNTCLCHRTQTEP